MNVQLNAKINEQDATILKLDERVHELEAPKKILSEKQLDSIQEQLNFRIDKLKDKVKNNNDMFLQVKEEFYLEKLRETEIQKLEQQLFKQCKELSQMKEIIKKQSTDMGLLKKRLDANPFAAPAEVQDEDANEIEIELDQDM